jgi:hypothetical protein
MDKKDTIEINGETYQKVDPNKTEIIPAVDTDHIVVIAQRGWIFEGHKDKSKKDEIVLLNANVVRSWSNGKGIGGLKDEANKSEYKLDPIGTVRLPNEAIIATVDLNW